ncbi:M48 family metallopeptidase [Pseudoxanthomonas beigongshangi]
MPFRLQRLIAKTPRSVERDVVALQLEDGRRIEVQRVRDPRARRLKLSVDERGARLTLPMRASLISGERFLHEHRAWLQAQLARQLGAEALPSLEPFATASLPLRGREVPVDWQEARYAAIRHDGESIRIQLPARLGEAALRRHLRAFYETEARADINRWLPRYLAALPRAPSPVRLKMMSSLWGSLSPDGAMTLDLSLIIARPSAFEYVLVHELCHLIHANHSRAFWREVEARFPAWRDERAYFHEHGRRLKAGLRALLAG